MIKFISFVFKLKQGKLLNRKIAKAVDAKKLP